MTFTDGAGFIAWEPSRHFVAGQAAPRVQLAPQMPPVDVEQGFPEVLSRISASISESATRLHQADFERANQRTETRRQLHETLGDLKTRVARKIATRPRPASANPAVEIAFKAS